jgi:hypothetical protein
VRPCGTKKRRSTGTVGAAGSPSPIGGDCLRGHAPHTRAEMLRCPRAGHVRGRGRWRDRGRRRPTRRRH